MMRLLFFRNLYHTGCGILAVPVPIKSSVASSSYRKIWDTTSLLELISCLFFKCYNKQSVLMSVEITEFLGVGDDLLRLSIRER